MKYIFCILLTALSYLAIGYFAPIESYKGAIADPIYHGADAITVAWTGEMVAYKWEKGKYKKMWKRR